MEFKFISYRSFRAGQFEFMKKYNIKFKQTIEEEIKGDGHILFYRFKPSFKYGRPICIQSLNQYYLSDTFEIPDEKFIEFLDYFKSMVGTPHIMYYCEWPEGMEKEIKHFRISANEELLSDYYE